jgi:uncharacterized cupredoxin-like copper-binding protein
MFKSKLLCCTLLLASGIVHAHGDRAHAPSSAVIKEQKAWGIAGDASAVNRTVEVSMGDDMRFQPATLSVKRGETIRFTVRNTGRQLHEFVIGTRDENARHAELMLRFPNMEHDEPYMAHVNPGKAGEVVWTFNKPGQFEFACLIAGHYQSGMLGSITVSEK